MNSITCNGRRIVRHWSAMARVATWRALPRAAELGAKGPIRTGIAGHRMLFTSRRCWRTWSSPNRWPLPRGGDPALLFREAASCRDTDKRSVRRCLSAKCPSATETSQHPAPHRAAMVAPHRPPLARSIETKSWLHPAASFSSAPWSRISIDRRLSLTRPRVWSSSSAMVTVSR
jgi:hypothetical protein